MRVPRSWRLGFWLAAGVPGAAAQTPPAPPAVAWLPRRPLQGSVVLLGVRAGGDSGLAVEGDVAGRPLRLEWSAGWYRALAGVPLDADTALPVRFVIGPAGGRSDTVEAVLPVARRRSRRERLRVAPRYVQPPDSLAPRLRAERELVQVLERRASETPRLWRERFARPSPGAVIDRFAVARVFNGRVRSRHLGVDFAGKMGDPVRAANRGVVAYVGDLYFSGTTVFLDHGGGLVTAYLHFSRAEVAVGDTVARGQVIGRVGRTGRATGPHLHWLATVGTVSVNPLDLLRLDFTAPLTAPR
jgi:murein DD-endopeptidase MepM/ murein hydrolase activator NlpD